MAKKLAHLSLIAAIAGIAGCSTSSTNPILTQFYREAGDNLNSGGFGDATLLNKQVMTGERQYATDLTNKFSADVTSMVTFDFNSAQLDANAQAVLRQQADWIRQFPEIRFRVYGHTDAVGSNAFNKRLGLRRANAVVNYLSTLGISRSRLEAVASFGETQPLVVTENRERRNRRTVTEVSGFVQSSRSQQTLDGKYAQIIYRDYVASGAAPTTLSEGLLESGTSSGSGF